MNDWTFTSFSDCKICNELRTSQTTVAVWLVNSTNPTTPAGYVGYVTQGAWLGKARFLDTQVGPTSFGRTWLADVVNVLVQALGPLFDSKQFLADLGERAVLFALWGIRIIGGHNLFG